MQTEAWRSMDATARAIYIEIAARYAGPGSNNGRIPYSVREAAVSLRIGKSTAGRALKRLQERGFIVPMTKGAFSLKLKHATEWRLTEFPCDITHALPTKEFARWSAETQKTIPAAGPTGTCGAIERYP
jgi:DNA-binding transcriptional regulator YhcF (GntR family)